VAEWYYIGHYGQLGPLTREQVDELIESGVIARDTYVWKTGMTDWLPASRVPELSGTFASSATQLPPPPPPPSPASAPASVTPISPYGTSPYEIASPSMYPSLRSDRSRSLAGILQIIVPGVGRMYLGYAAYGVLQLVLAIGTCGLLWLWSIIDGIIILSGGVKLDGYGRQLAD
jgi:hypothetical protein